MNDNTNNNGTNPPTDDQVLSSPRPWHNLSQNQENFETDSNWTDVRSQLDDDEIIFIEDEEINKVEDEIFNEDDENEESKNGGLPFHRMISFSSNVLIKRACQKMLDQFLPTNQSSSSTTIKVQSYTIVSTMISDISD